MKKHRANIAAGIAVRIAVRMAAGITVRMAVRMAVAIIVAFNFATISSCTKESEADTVAPIIDMVLPQEGDTLFINEDAHLEINISDERELDSCRFEVHANFGNHVHKSSIIDRSPDASALHSSALHESTLSIDVPWFYTRTYYLAGIKSTTLHDYAFRVPDFVGQDPIAQGNYHFQVDCWDKAGNHTSVLLNIIIAAKPDASQWIRLITKC